MLGSPEAGKSMLARRLTTILPAMTLPEALETPCLHRVAGRTGDHTTLVTTRPCRAPHHTISAVGLILGDRYRCHLMRRERLRLVCVCGGVSRSVRNCVKGNDSWYHAPPKYAMIR
jgi:magnesium chelatase subunit ChlI-like protein